MNVAIDTARYKKDRDAKAISLMPIPGNTTRALIARRNFDPTTGKELDPQIIALNPAELAKAKAELQAQMDGLDEMLKDLEAIGVVPAAPEEAA